MGAQARKEVSFSSRPEDAAVIAQIAKRGAALAKQYRVRRTRMDVMMDVTACHLNGCPLDLEKLLAADEFNFAHDVFGIARHLDHQTGELQDHFLPRCSLPEHA